MIFQGHSQVLMFSVSISMTPLALPPPVAITLVLHVCRVVVAVIEGAVDSDMVFVVEHIL